MRKGCLALALMLLSGSVARAQEKPTKIAEGVWAMMTGGGSNAGWFTFGDSVIAVDSGRSGEEAEKLLAAIAETAGKKPVSYLILTNNFIPHAGGAAVFARRGATVVCQERFGPMTSALVNESNPKGRSSASRPAVLTLSTRLDLVSGDRRVEIDFPGPADSGGDLVVYVVDAQVLFSGDLAESAILPPLFSAAIDPDGWQNALDNLLRLSVKSLVPGYGPIGPVEGLRATRFYLHEVWETAQRIASERTPDDFLPTRLKEPDIRIKGLPEELEKSHEANLLALIKMLRARNPQPTAR